MKSQVELLMLLADNASQDGDELVREQQKIDAERNKLYTAHAHRLVELSQMIDHARLVIETEKARFARWLPQEASHAAQGGLGSLDDKREHSRTAPPRLPPAQPSSNSGHRAGERAEDAPTRAQAAAR